MVCIHVMVCYISLQFGIVSFHVITFYVVTFNKICYFVIFHMNAFLQCFLKRSLGVFSASDTKL